jgi:hypothetical protein
MNRIVKRGLALVGAVVVLGGMAACSTTAAPDYVLIRYEKGVNGGLKFESCLQPSQKGDAAVNDQTFALPVSLRTWNIRPEGQGGDSSNAVQTGTLPQPATETQPSQVGPEVKVFTKTEFFLNTACKQQDKEGEIVHAVDPEGKKKEDAAADSAQAPLARFWEATGRRYDVATDGESGFSEDNWVKMLQATLVPAMEKAVRSSSRLYDADDLDANTGNVWATMEKQMGVTFSAELNASVGGGDYFCGPTYRRNSDGTAAVVDWTEPVVDAAGKITEKAMKGTCPPVRITITDVVFAQEGIANARAEAYAQDQRNNAALSKAKADKAIADLSRDPNVMRIREMENERAIAEACARAGANCTLIQGVGPGVNVNAGK